MTREEFEEGYARASGLTVHELKLYGLFSEHCRCGDLDCPGWMMNRPWEAAIVEDRMRSVPLREVRDAMGNFVTRVRVSDQLME